ncbi:DMT family transporter [Pelomicrobium methylotrophicum]|uniref:DMT family transporter n=1 Tax=Pelomicrobium methylotrophicum TaxID=2602750 RepID=A0A5C7ETJ4_9PROT|nr:DMT family transporter [Pelomicrobium methylotrophicum]TXF10672.1 DMT family transporter [Pelomicrobium methylotrophicum]
MTEPHRTALVRIVARAAPGVFVVLWSTGFIGAKLGLSYAEPLTFLILRFLLAVGLLVPLALGLGSRWPRNALQVGHVAVAGVLLHAGYLGGVFAAIHQGLPAGVVSLIVGLQPLVTAVAAPRFLGERVSGRQWLGFALGLAGVVLVVSEELRWQDADLAGLALAALALFSITAGTLYQKRHGASADLAAGSIIQFTASALVLAPLAYLLESRRVVWSGEFLFALGWLVLVLSLGAISLLYMMLRRGEAARISSLFYLTPPVTAVIAFVAFDETLGAIAVAGMGLAAAGVWLVMRG